MSEPRIDTSYEPFSQEPEYVELNRAFVQTLLPHLARCRRILDLACGTGVLTQLLLEHLRPDVSGRPTNDALVPVAALGVDLSRESLKLAREQMDGLPWRPPTALIECSADAPPVRSGSVDVVLIGNAIHCFPDKDGLAAEIHRVLAPSGLFAFNSSFYSGTISVGTEEFYHQWLKGALEHLRQKDADLRRAGREGITRVRGRGKPAFSSRWLSPAEYGAVFERHGFEVRSVSERVYEMSQRNFETVGAYAGLAVVLLSGYPAEAAAEALEAAVGPAFRALGARTIPRVSLELVAVKR
ncbi:MAG TPA: class I SAM-dependent methyltransferase [Methylomirabilota bacterium]|nr:class I SAM-dependent methyltransferase [Methylomirabilota bacterium]